MAPRNLDAKAKLVSTVVQLGIMFAVTFYSIYIQLHVRYYVCNLGFDKQYTLRLGRTVITLMTHMFTVWTSINSRLRIVFIINILY